MRSAADQTAPFSAPFSEWHPVTTLQIHLSSVFGASCDTSPIILPFFFHILSIIPSHSSHQPHPPQWLQLTAGCPPMALELPNVLTSLHQRLARAAGDTCTARGVCRATSTFSVQNMQSQSCRAQLQSCSAASN